MPSPAPPASSISPAVDRAREAARAVAEAEQALRKAAAANPDAGMAAVGEGVTAGVVRVAVRPL